MDIHIAAWFLIISLQHLAAISDCIYSVHGHVSLFNGFVVWLQLFSVVSSVVSSWPTSAPSAFAGFLQNWLRPSRSKVCKYLSLTSASCQEMQQKPQILYILIFSDLFFRFHVILRTLRHTSSTVQSKWPGIQMGFTVGISTPFHLCWAAPGTQPSASSFSRGIIFRKLLWDIVGQTIARPQRKANSIAQLAVQGYHCRSMSTFTSSLQ